MYSGFYPELMGEFLRTLKAMEIDYYKPAVKGLRAKIALTWQFERKE
jgi:hypothetical protein